MLSNERTKEDRGVKELFWAAAVTVPLIAAPISIGMVHSLAAPSAAITVVASGLENPRGLVFGPDRKLYVAEGASAAPR